MKVPWCFVPQTELELNTVPNVPNRNRCRVKRRECLRSSSYRNVEPSVAAAGSETYLNGVIRTSVVTVKTGRDKKTRAERESHNICLPPSSPSQQCILTDRDGELHGQKLEGKQNVRHRSSHLSSEVTQLLLWSQNSIIISKYRTTAEF